MKSTPVFSFIACALLLAGCAANESGSTASGTLNGELVGVGASSQGAAQEAWIAGFQTANPSVVVNYDPAGSGTGRETFQNGASAFAGSDRAFKTEEIASGTFGSCAEGSDLVEFPAYISPIAIVFNLAGADALNLDAATVAQIFNGAITRWNDPAIAATNPGVALPNTAITPVHRSDKSGTTENFTDYLAAAAPEQWTVGAVEEWPAAFGGEGAQGTSGVISAVSAGNGTIGYADASRAGELPTVAIKVGEQFVAYTPEAAAAVVDASQVQQGRAATDMAITVDRSTTAEGVYPIVLVSYLIGCAEYADSANAELVKSYFTYVVSEEGQSTAAQAAGSAPLSATQRQQISTIVESIR